MSQNREGISGPAVHYVMVCHGKNCTSKGSPELLRSLRSALAGDDQFRVIPTNCFGACTVSPNIAVFPDRLWFSLVRPEDLGRVASAVREGREIPDLSGKVSPDVVNLVFRLLARPLRG